MGRIGKVISSYIAKLSGNSKLAQHIAVEEFSGDERKAQVFGPCNEDFAPPVNVKTFDVHSGQGVSPLLSLAYANEQIAPQAVAGERRLFSTNAAGDTVKAEVFLKQDGTILIKNGAVTIEADPAGLLTITTTGDSVINSASALFNCVVTADDFIANGISYLGHNHAQANDSGGSVEADTSAAQAGP